MLAVGIFHGLPLYLLTASTNAGCRTVLVQDALPSGYEPDDQRNLTPVSNSFAVCAFRDLILPPFSAFFTEKKLRK